MIEKGYQLTCEGCGVKTFITSQKTPRKLNFKPGTLVIDHNKDQSESWVIVHKLFDLCPRCAKIHEEVLSNFYERCTEARDKDDFGL